MPPRRVLVTGSRDWSDQQAVARELVRYATGNWVLVHGACPTGADKIADDWATYHGITVEPHPADWRQFGKVAGYKRNQEMVDLGADVCLAFMRPCTKPTCRMPKPHWSHGTVHCAKRARAAGIEVREIHE